MPPELVESIARRNLGMISLSTYITDGIEDALRVRLHWDRTMKCVNPIDRHAYGHDTSLRFQGSHITQHQMDHHLKNIKRLAMPAAVREKDLIGKEFNSMMSSGFSEKLQGNKEEWDGIDGEAQSKFQEQASWRPA